MRLSGKLVVRYDCPEGCRWELPLKLAINKYGFLHEGVACPNHRLYAKRAK